MQACCLIPLVEQFRQRLRIKPHEYSRGILRLDLSCHRQLNALAAVNFLASLRLGIDLNGLSGSQDS